MVYTDLQLEYEIMLHVVCLEICVLVQLKSYKKSRKQKNLKQRKKSNSFFKILYE